jgi:hypothetical protein
VSKLKGLGERSSAAHSAVRGLPRDARKSAMRPKPSAIGTGRAKRARSMAKPGSAMTPCEYGNTPSRNA